MSDPPPGRPSRGLRAFFRRWRRKPSESAAGVPTAPGGPLDLVDQAQAFKSLIVGDVMTPRADIVAVEISCPFNELLARFLEAEHTRMPIYRETLDDPVGQVHVKDVFKMLVDERIRPAPDEPVLRRLRREILYAPGSMRAADLLLKMQASRTHMALIVDEFGGTDGLVTLEDLIEAVVGEIDDEHDEAAAKTVIRQNDGSFVATGRASLEEAVAVIGPEFDVGKAAEEVDTVAGYIVTLVDRVPVRGELVPGPGAFEIEILDADPRRVKRVRIYPSKERRRGAERNAARRPEARIPAPAPDRAEQAPAAAAAEAEPPAGATSKP